MKTFIIRFNINIAVLFFFQFISYNVLSQNILKAYKQKSSKTFITSPTSDVFGKRKSFIQNIGQYGDTLPKFGYMGKVQYGFEGFGRPVLFTPRGLIFLQRQVKPEPPLPKKRE